VGYRQLWQYLDGECSLETAVDKGIAATRQLAKRQLTWLRKWPDLAWIYTDYEGNLAENPLSELPSSQRRPGSSDPGRVLEGKSPLDAALNYLGHNPI
jgi:tRNA dimethylallyltransferase